MGAAELSEVLRQSFPLLAESRGEALAPANPVVEGAAKELGRGCLSWALLNQLLHRASEAGMSEGFFRYYFLSVPPRHPYDVRKVFRSVEYQPPDGCTEVESLEQLKWGFTRFTYDAMLFWGNFRQAYRDLRCLSFSDIEENFSRRRFDEDLLRRRGAIQRPKEIPRDHRYLISEIACKTFEAGKGLEEAKHVQMKLQAFRELQRQGVTVTPERLKEKTKQVAEAQHQLSLFELMFEEASDPLPDEASVIALYEGQWKAFKQAREDALENTRIYLSACSDLDVYVATSMRSRDDFREMAAMCERIFSAEKLKPYNIRYFDPTLSAAQHHEDKGLIECLMVKTAKMLLYFAQHKESLGKVSEYAMALTQGKPVIVLCPDDQRGHALYTFYRDAHPLMRLVHFETGVVHGAMITNKVDIAVELIRRVLSGGMEYDLELKPGTTGYYLLKERLTGSTVRIVTDDRLLTETFWNNWHGIA